MTDTRDHILKVALGLFLQKPYSDVSLNEIVEEVGLTKGAFYHHFKCKEELFVEVVENFHIRGQQNLVDSIPKESLKAFLNGYLERIVEFVDQFTRSFGSMKGTKGISFYNLSFDALRLLPGYELKIQEIHDRERNAWMEVIHNSKKSGELNCHMSDSQLAKMFIGIKDGVGLNLILEGKVEDMPGEVFTMWMGLYNLIKF